MTFLRLSAGFCLLAFSTAAFASTARIPNTSLEIRIDGRLDEDAWRNATQIEIDKETRPGENIPAKVTTTAYILEDGESLFIAFDARDPDPSAIRAFLRDRDSAWNDDFVGVVLDTYNDERRAFEFFANPLGVQMDLTNDDVNGNEDSSWDAIWDSAGRIHDAGYVVEMEIPLSQLRFPSNQAEQTWGIDLLRFYPRDHRYRFSNNALDREVNCYLCQMSKISGLENAKPSRDLEIVPTIPASQTESTDDPGVVPLDGSGADGEVGVSIRWGITPDLTANFAVNPDFSQVEADVAQLDVNNQFALFFPERRPFFLEGADYFNTPMRAVFTRTVADPTVGAKLTGKRGKNTFGAFMAEDDVTNILFPGAFGSDGTTLDGGNTAFVGRYSRSFGDASSVGALLTSRQGDDYHNHVGGLDMRWRINDNHNLQVQYLRTDTEYPDEVATEFDQPLGSFDGTGAYVGYNYSSREYGMYVRHLDKSNDFRADSGFIPRVDSSTQVIGGRRTWYGDEDDWYNELRINGDWDITHDDQGRVLEREVEAYFSISGPMQSFVQVGGLNRDVLFDDILFEETKISLYGEVKPKGGLSLGVFSRWGDQVDFSNSRLGDQVLIEPFVNWNVNTHLLLRWESVFVSLDTQDGQQIFDAEVHDLRATWQFSRRSFLRLTTQYQSVERNQDVYLDEVDSKSERLGAQLLYSYKLNPQTVFFLGYSDNHVDDDDLEKLTATDRTLFMKIGYAWTP